MPDTRFVNDILSRMSEAVERGDMQLAQKICAEQLAVELGSDDAKRHLDTMSASGSKAAS